MQRRIGLAQALINNPELILLDEPTSGLDPIGTAEIKNLIRDLREQGKTIVLSGHLLADMQDICDRIAILHRGELKELGRVSDLLTVQDVTQIKARNLSPAALDEIRDVILRHGGEDWWSTTRRPRSRSCSSGSCTRATCTRAVARWVTTPPSPPPRSKASWQARPSAEPPTTTNRPALRRPHPVSGPRSCLPWPARGRAAGVVQPRLGLAARDGAWLPSEHWPTAGRRASVPNTRLTPPAWADTSGFHDREHQDQGLEDLSDVRHPPDIAPPPGAGQPAASPGPAPSPTQQPVAAQGGRAGHQGAPRAASIPPPCPSRAARRPRPWHAGQPGARPAQLPPPPQIDPATVQLARAGSTSPAIRWSATRMTCWAGPSPGSRRSA